MRVRVVTFNVENLFSRAKVLNFSNHSNGDTILPSIADLQIYHCARGGKSRIMKASRP